jgi:hypothetical protein
MARTTFSGPIRAGNIFNTTGTTVGTDIANVGQVVMAQSSAITQTSSATTIVIPANSQIVEMTLYVTTAWTGVGVAQYLTLGNTVLATAYTAIWGVNGGTIGVVSITPGTDATRTLAFVDVGATDVNIVASSDSPGAGAGYLTVRYVQANNLVA